MSFKKAIDYDRLADLVAAKQTVQEISDTFGINVNTYWNRRKTDPAFAAAIARGTARRNGSPVPAAEDVVSEAPSEVFVADVTDDDDVFDDDFGEPEPDLTDYVRQAVSLGLNLPRAIARDINVPVCQVIPVCEELVEAGEFEKVETPTFTAFFPAGKVPPGRPFLNGDGGVHFAVDVPAVPAPAESFAKLEAASIASADARMSTPKAFFVDGRVNAVGDDRELENAEDTENPSAFNVTLTGGVEVAVDLKISVFEFAEMDDSERSLVLGLLDLCRNFKQGGDW